MPRVSTCPRNVFKILSNFFKFCSFLKDFLRNNPPQNQYYSNHNNGAQSPNRGVQPALTGYNRGNNGASIQPPAEVIQHAVNRAVQQYLGQMGGYGKRPFVDDSSFATGYQTQKSPQHGSGGHSPIHPSGLSGRNQRQIDRIN